MSCNNFLNFRMKKKIMIQENENRKAVTETL